MNALDFLQVATDSLIADDVPETPPTFAKWALMTVLALSFNFDGV